MTVLRKPGKKPQLWNHMLKSLQSKTPYHCNHALTRNLSMLLLSGVGGRFGDRPLREILFLHHSVAQLHILEIKL